MWKAGAEQIPKLTVRVRFPPPDHGVEARVRKQFPSLGPCSSRRGFGRARAIRPQTPGVRRDAVPMAIDIFNADYWAAVAAVAPVLALANTVTMVSVGRTYLDRKAAEQRPELRWGEEARPNNINGWRRRQGIAVFNYVLQAIATAAALFSLATATSWSGRRW
jgi:hypothetical protein